MKLESTQALWLHEFRANYGDLLRFLRRRTRCDETARDLAHDAWLRVADRPADGAAAPPASPEHARAYLFTVAERLAIDHLRRRRLWDDELLPRLSASPGHTPDVAESHAYAQALQAIDGALNRMPPRMRQVFIAHRLDGVPHGDLASLYQVSRKTIEREITQAMDLAQAALDATPPDRRGRRKALGALLGLFGISASGTLAWQLWQQTAPGWQTALAAPGGLVRTVDLPDGSAVTLDAGSTAEARLFADRRELRLLAGRVFLAVAHDADRPFRVIAGDVLVTVLGTRFSVELQDGSVAVQVESGRVAVQAAGHSLELGAGDTARARPGQAPQRGQVSAVAGWRHGWLDFDHATLAATAAQLNRYRPDTPVTVDTDAASLPIVARVHVPRSTQWLLGLQEVLPVRVAVAPDGSVRIRHR